MTSLTFRSVPALILTSIFTPLALDVNVWQLLKLSSAPDDQSFQDLEDWMTLVQKVYTQADMPYLAILANKADLTHMRTVRPTQHTEFAVLHKMHRWAEVAWCNCISIPLLKSEYGWCLSVQLFCFGQDRRQCGFSILPHCGRHSWHHSYVTWHQQCSKGDYSSSYQSSPRRAQQQHEQKTYQKPDKVLHHVAIIVCAQTHHLQLTLDHLHKALASTCCNIAAILLQYWCSAFCKACLQHTEKRLWAGFPAPWLMYSAENLCLSMRPDNETWSVATSWSHV